MDAWKQRKEENERNLREALRILKGNKEQVPEELLNTRYRKSYLQLKKNVKDLAEEYLRLHVLYGICCSKEKLEELADLLNDKIADSGLLIKISRALYREQDMEKVEALTAQMGRIVWFAAAPYNTAFKEAA